MSSEPCPIVFHAQLAATYVGLFRNIPLLLQLFLWFFVVPELLPRPMGPLAEARLPFPEFWTSILALGLFTSARVAVQVGSGIAAVSNGQRMAAFASGMSAVQTYRCVLLPQAFRIVLPPLTSDFLTIFKNSALALDNRGLRTDRAEPADREFYLPGF